MQGEYTARRARKINEAYRPAVLSLLRAITPLTWINEMARRAAKSRRVAGEVELGVGAREP